MCEGDNNVCSLGPAVGTSPIQTHIDTVRSKSCYPDFTRHPFSLYGHVYVIVMGCIDGSLSQLFGEFLLHGERVNFVTGERVNLHTCILIQVHK